MTKKRINVTMSEEFYRIIKKRADLLGISVPSVLVFYAMQGINQEEAISSLNSVSDVINQFEKMEK